MEKCPEVAQSYVITVVSHHCKCSPCLNWLHSTEHYTVLHSSSLNVNVHTVTYTSTLTGWITQYLTTLQKHCIYVILYLCFYIIVIVIWKRITHARWCCDICLIMCLQNISSISSIRKLSFEIWLPYCTLLQHNTLHHINKLYSSVCRWHNMSVAVVHHFKVNCTLFFSYWMRLLQSRVNHTLLYYLLNKNEKGP